MDNTQLKESLKNLDLSRSELEKEIAIIIEKLGKVGMQSSLIDSEGFPLPDIDTLTIRQLRQSVIMKKNDLKGIMSQIDAMLVQLHANTSGEHINASKLIPNVQNRVQQTSEPAVEVVQASTPSQEVGSLVPFALVDEVSEESPAHIAGIRIGDKLVEVGTVSGAFSSSSSSLLTMVAVEVRMNQGKELKVVVQRVDQRVNLILIPRQWHGVGLLGCHIVPC
jgi:26S proteasome non-ATPase regulatory subunit 9